MKLREQRDETRIIDRFCLDSSSATPTKFLAFSHHPRHNVLLVNAPCHPQKKFKPSLKHLCSFFGEGMLKWARTNTQESCLFSSKNSQSFSFRYQLKIYYIYTTTLATHKYTQNRCSRGHWLPLNTCCLFSFLSSSASNKFI